MKDAAWSSAVLGTSKIQAVVLMPVVLAFWGLASRSHAVSCLAGALVVALPNFVVGAVLWLRVVIAGRVNLAVLLMGEGAKLLLIFAGLYGGIRMLGSDIAWLAFITGILVALKAQWLALWFTRDA